MFGISVEHHKVMVTELASELIKERWSTDAAPERRAKAAARASAAPSPQPAARLTA